MRLAAIGRAPHAAAEPREDQPGSLKKVAMARGGMLAR
jgi:hypothetical protein